MKKDEIYIDCQPVDSDGQTTIKYDLKKNVSKKSVTFDFDDVLTSPYLALIIGALSFVILVKLSKYVMKKI